MADQGQGPVPQWAFTGFSLYRNTGKAHQSLSGSKDQIIDNREVGSAGVGWRDGEKRHTTVIE